MKPTITFFTLLCSIFFYQILSAQNWEEQAIGTLPANYGVFDISVVDENIVWVVAFDQSSITEVDNICKVLKTVDGGVSWKSFDIEEAEGRVSLDIEAFDANVAFISTQDFGNGSGKGLFKTEDGGETWVENFNSPAGGVWIRFFNEQDGVIINRQSIATTQNGGESWQIVAPGIIPQFENDEFTAISSGNNSCQVIGNYIWFGTNKGRIYRSKDKGNTWEVFETSLGNNAIILSLAFRDTLNGITLDAYGANTVFAKTEDGGESWNNIISNPEIPITNIEYVTDTDSTLIGTSDITIEDANRVSVYSSDFGKNWQIINNNIPFGGIEFISPNIGWTSRGIVTAIGQGAMFKWQGDIFLNSFEINTPAKIEIYPNPFIDEIFIESPKVLKEYRLSTVNGKIVQVQKFNLDKNNIDFHNLGLGMYLLDLIFSDGSTLSKKIYKAN